MIDFYTWATPNGRKISIALEEMGLAYKIFPIDIMKNQQFAPEFLNISPNNKIPAIVDHETDLTLMESGAILLYLAQKSGKFWPQNGNEKWKTVEWLMWQMGGFGPMLGQAHHFMHFNPNASDYAKERYGKEAQRLYQVLEKRLSEVPFVAGEYSIADMAIWPWATRFEWQGIKLGDYPNISRWYLEILNRPAVQKGYHIPKESGPIPMPKMTD